MLVFVTCETKVKPCLFARRCASDGAPATRTAQKLVYVVLCDKIVSKTHNNVKWNKRKEAISETIFYFLISKQGRKCIRMRITCMELAWLRDAWSVTQGGGGGGGGALAWKHFVGSWRETSFWQEEFQTSSCCHMVPDS